MRDIEWHIRAALRILTAEEGGRSTPGFSGYRPQFYYSDRDWVCEQYYEGVEVVNPGDHVTAKISFMSPACHVDRIHIGSKFTCREGARTIAEGEVIEVFPALLKYEPIPWP